MKQYFPLLREAFWQGVKAASPRGVVSTYLKKEGGRIGVNTPDGWFDITPASGGRLIVIATGKAATELYRGAIDVVGNPDTGIVVTGDSSPSLPGAVHLRGGHPYPDEGSVAAARQVLSTLIATKEADSLIYLLSGGSSSMVCFPEPGISLEEKARTIEALMKSGASIDALNSVRKALSQVKGGKLARAVHTSRACVLVLSDVPGNDLSVIGSGPFFRPEAYRDPLHIIETLSAREKVPASVLRFLKKQNTDASAALSGTRIPHIIIADNESALSHAGAYLSSRGYRLDVRREQVLGEALSAGFSLGGMALEAHRSGRGEKTAFLAGGETVVTVRGAGRGGRNQEMAMGAALALNNTEGIVGLCAATDGIDGNSTAAGGFFDGSLLTRAQRMGADHEQYLANNDSYTFLNMTGYSFVTGPTGTNVMDIFLCLIHR